jgi:hypothetical protein
MQITGIETLSETHGKAQHRAMLGNVPAKFVSGEIVRFVVLRKHTIPNAQNRWMIEHVGPVSEIGLGIYCELRTNIEPANVGFAG